MSVSEILGIISGSLSLLAILIVIVYRAIYSIKQDKDKKSGFIQNVIREVIDAEVSIKGRKMGAMRLNQVLTKLGRKDKKAVKTVNNIHSILKDAKKSLEDITKDNESVK